MIDTDELVRLFKAVANKRRLEIPRLLIWVYYSINDTPSESCREILELVRQSI